MVATTDLAAGIPALEERLGVALAPGARHPWFGTHNALLRVGATTYLELIAVDPEAPPPGRARWFGLDDPTVRARLSVAPVLLHWVARPAVLPPGPDDHGERLRLHRGPMTWTVTVPADGALPGDGRGLVPSLIHWDGAHPTDTLPDAGVRLERLVLTGPEGRHLRARLAGLGLSALATVSDGPPMLHAELRTPLGAVTLDGP